MIYRFILHPKFVPSVLFGGKQLGGLQSASFKCSEFILPTKLGPKLNYQQFSCKSTFPSSESSGKNKPYYLLGLPAFAFCLFIWQLRRREWKLELLAQLHEMVNLPPISLPPTAATYSDIREYQPIKVKGKFDHSKEMLIGPRYLLQESLKGEDYRVGLASNPIGFLVVTPFILSDSKKTILVNRGWVHRNQRNPATRKESQIEEEIKLVGLSRCPEKISMFVSTPGQPSSDGSFPYRDIDTMAYISGTQPIWLDAKFESTIKGGPVGGQSVIHLRNEHLQYAITWFTLSALTTAMWMIKYSK